MKVYDEKERFSIIGDLTAKEERDITNIYRRHSMYGVRGDEKISLNWRVVDNRTKRTICVFGGGAGYDAACVFKEYCEEYY